MPQRSIYLHMLSGSSSVVECFLAKEDVAGSNPVSRSKLILFPEDLSGKVESSPQLGHPGWRGTQVVRERSAKPLCVGSIPTRASNRINPSIDFAPTRKCGVGGDVWVDFSTLFHVPCAVQ